MELSECCEAKIVPKIYPAVCSECRQFCDIVIIPTTHKEKTVNLYGDTDMSIFRGEIPFLEKRLEKLNDTKKIAVSKSDYKRALEIEKAEKLFREMIKEADL